MANLRDQSPSTSAIAILLVGAAGIALAPIFVRLSEVGPVATAFYRMGISLPVFWAWLIWFEGTGATSRRPASKSDYAQLALAGVFFAGDLAVWHWSIQITSVANATLLANFAPIFVTFGAVLFFGERFTRLFYSGLIVAIIGAAVLLGDSAGHGGRNLLGDALGIATAVFYAAYFLTVARLRAVFSTVTVMAWSGASASVLLAILAVLSGEILFAQTAFGWIVLILLALISHAIGQSLIAYALAHLSAAFSSVTLLLQPALAAILAWLILNEPLGPVQTLGAVIILIGILIARRGTS